MRSVFLTRDDEVNDMTQMHSSVSIELFNVDQRQAQLWLSGNNYRFQRPIRNQHVSYLASEIEKGRFVNGTMVHFAKLNGHCHLVNGQHTLSAIVQSGKSQLLAVKTTSVSDEKQIAELYFREDNHLSRQISDAFRALNMEESTGLTLTQQQWVGSAIYLIKEGFIRKGGSKQRVSRDELANGVAKLAPQARDYFQGIAGCRDPIQRALTRQATVAVALTTFLYCNDTAKKFWRQVALCDGLRIGDPRKTLFEFLVEVGSSGGGVTNKRSANAAYHCRAIASAWNACFEGRSLKIIKVIDEGLPIKLLGTPYHGENNQVGIVL